MTPSRIVDVDEGVALVVTDLHGAGAVYDRVRERFLALREQDAVQRLVLCGDLIHNDGAADKDDSLRMILDVMRLQEELGSDTVLLLLGNHEMPHIYSISISKGDIEYTARFEHALEESGKREAVLAFLRRLPLYVRTKAGVLLTHAGASPAVTTTEAAENILSFDHDALLMLAEDRLRNGYDLGRLGTDTNYLRQAAHYLAVTGAHDPRLHHLLRGQLLSQTEEQFHFLWDVLFTYNEKTSSEQVYSFYVQKFLEAISALSEHEQRVVVAGHIGTRGGHRLVGERHLRLSSYAHANPTDAGEVLLLDCAAPVQWADELIPHLQPTLV